MQDDHEWVQVEVTWDEGFDGEIEWDSTGWDDDPLFDPKPQPLPRPALERYLISTQRADNRTERRGERTKPKRERERSPMTKRKRKRMRAWEIEEDE